MGKLGELPYTPPPKVRAPLSQPPWVTASKLQSSSADSKDKLLTAASLDASISGDRLDEAEQVPVEAASLELSGNVAGQSMQVEASSLGQLLSYRPLVQISVVSFISSSAFRC